MPATKPKTKKRKGKQLEEKVAQIIHDIFFESCIVYRNEYLQNRKIAPHRDFSSGNFNHNPCDIELNYLQKYLPFCIECKNWSEFNKFTIFDLFKPNSKILNKLIKIFNSYKGESLPNNIIRLVVFKSDYTDILVFYQIKDFAPEFINKLTVNYLNQKLGFGITRFTDFIRIYIDTYINEGVENS